MRTGERFIEYFDKYFSEFNGIRINKRIKRETIEADFKHYWAGNKTMSNVKGSTIQKKLRAYAEYRGYSFNTKAKGKRWRANKVDYNSLTTTEFAIDQTMEDYPLEI